MTTGELNRPITIKTITTVTTSGNDVESKSTGVTVRARVRQLDGSRFLNVAELTDKAVYEITTWDNSYGMNIEITYGSLTLRPLRPPTVNPDASGRDVVSIIAVTKR
jgi:hypothetical protein